MANPNVAVVIPVLNAGAVIYRCIASILEQEYAGKITIYVVATEDDKTWEVIKESVQQGHITPVFVNRPVNFQGRDSNLKRFTGVECAVSQGADIVALTDHQISVPKNWISSIVTIIREQEVSIVAGITVRQQDDTSFESLYHDESIVSEHPRFGKKFLLSKETHKQAKGFPVTANFALTRDAFLNMKSKWPTYGVHGWEDFLLAWVMISEDQSILCTDDLVVYRNHRRSLRTVKHFSSGMSFAFFLKAHPECSYAQKRLLNLAVFLLLICICFFLAVSSLLLAGLFGMGILLACMCISLLLLGCINVKKANDWRAIVFPWIAVFHIVVWTVGAAYVIGTNGHVSPKVTQAVMLLRK